MLKVILADDEETIRTGMASLINSYQLPLEIAGLAENGLQALSMIDECQPEILIIDINMPYLNGLDTIEAVRLKYPDMKIIIVSGYDNFFYAQKALELGVYAYLLKPLEFNTFKNTLESAISGYERRLMEISLLNKHGYSDPRQTSVTDEIQAYIKNHYTNSELSLSSMADHFCVSDSTMAKLIKKRTSMNFSEYLNQLRIESAERLLLTTELSIFEISSMVGYSSQHYFSRIFKKHRGISPENYRKEKRLKS